MKEIQSRISEIIKMINDEVRVDNDVSGGYLEEPFEQIVTKLYQMQEEISERQTSTKVNKQSDSKALHIADVSKRISCYVAKNKDEFDVENMSLYKTKSKAVKEWGKEQEIVKATIIF